MTNITKLPEQFRYRRLVTATEVYGEPEASDEMTWALCDYIRVREAEFECCQRCAKWTDTNGYGPGIVGCYAIAEEACRVVMAAAKNFPPPKPDIPAKDSIGTDVQHKDG